VPIPDNRNAVINVKNYFSESKPASITESEWEARVNVAALYRLVALYGWDDMVSGHVSGRIPGYEDRFLLNPYGMHFEEITASSLIVMDLNGNQIGESEYTFHRAGFTIHSAVYAYRNDAHYAIHLHTNYGIAVSCQAQGLLPLNQTALTVYSDVAYHDYEGPTNRLDEREGLAKNLGKNNAMILRNHGTLACGPNAGGAWQVIFRLERACEYQILALTGGSELILPSGDPIKANSQLSNTETLKKRGGYIWPALLRKLDRVDPSYRT
jgi:ribulose-5-phosphate 4-epimerase/fuculose-1-phosphate aldolase